MAKSWPISPDGADQSTKEGVPQETHGLMANQPRWCKINQPNWCTEYWTQEPMIQGHYAFGQITDHTSLGGAQITNRRDVSTYTSSATSIWGGCVW